MENQVTCQTCPVLNIVHNSGEQSQIKYCVMAAALKQAATKYQTCGQDLDVQFNEVEDTPSAADKLDQLEAEVESLNEKQ